jgi:predicted ATPase/DNA-binding winged helix-turn-helix (wHTH) protein
MSLGADAYAVDTVTFGPFQLTVSQRLLTKNGQPVALKGRALDILIVLVENAGHVLNHRDLIKRVWPDVVVEDANLRVHIANLRKALGDGQGGARYISNVAGRGYCFVAPVYRVDHDLGRAPLRSESGAAKLPTQPSFIVGRDDVVQDLCALLLRQRFVSIVGPGGIGKTTVAIATAHAVANSFNDVVCFVDLSTMSTGGLVVTALASSLGGFVQADDPLPGLLAFLADKRMLIVLDSCEHVIEDVAALADAIMRAAPHTHLLATTREALRIEGENIYLLGPLEGPPDKPDVRAADALAAPAVQLFLERAKASGYTHDFGESDALIAARICRRLDGIALAIELTASRVGAYGLLGTAAMLDERLPLLWKGRRTASSRHKTLQATLDWSYDLLAEHEKHILCALSVFVGGFTLEAAQTVIGEIGSEAHSVAETIAALVDKSLVSIQPAQGGNLYRLLDTTRAYAKMRLAERGGQDSAARRHALYFAEHLALAGVPTPVYDERLLAASSLHLDDIRAALEWSFSASGDATIGVELGARAAPVFLSVSLLGECRHWGARALAVLNEDERGTTRELELQEALAIANMYTRGNIEDVRAAIERGLDIARALGDERHELHLLAGLHIFFARRGDFESALDAAERCAAVARRVGAPTGIVMAEWMLGSAYHLVGRQLEAQRHLERGFGLAASSGSQIHQFGYDHRVRALASYARVLWLRGLPDQALKAAHTSIAEAARTADPITLCISLVGACVAFLWCGEFVTAEDHISRLIEEGAKHRLSPFQATGLALRGELLVARGEPAAGLQLLRDAGSSLLNERHQWLALSFARALAEGLARCGHQAQALATIDEAIAQVEEGKATFERPDLLRTRGEILMMARPPDLSAAETSLLESLEFARAQDAPSLELRTALPLAQLWLKQGRAAPAATLLDKILGRFTEGLESADLAEARRLLAAIPQ